MKILITGGSGFIGINITLELLRKGYEVIVYSRHPLPYTAIRIANKQEGIFRWVQGDVLDESKIARTMRTYQPDSVIHAAAVTPDQKREKDQMDWIVQVNCLGTLYTLKAAAKSSVKRFIYVSSVAVYGDCAQKYSFVTEKCEKNPVNTYELTKYTTERLVKQYAKLYGMDAVALRLGDVFGAWEYRSGVRDLMSAPCQMMFYALQNKNAVLPKEGATGWVYSIDMALAVAALLDADNLNHYAYNCGGIWNWSIAEFGDEIRRYIPDFAYEISEERKANVKFFSILDNGMFDMSRLEKDTGFRPLYDLKKSVDHYIHWALDYPELILQQPKR